MNAEDDAFDALINGPEVASDHDRAVIDILANELATSMPASTIKRYIYQDLENGISAEISTEFDEEILAENTFTYLKIDNDDELQFMLVFDPNNELAEFRYALDVSPVEVVSLIDTLLQSEGEPIDIKTVAILKHAQSLLNLASELTPETHVTRVASMQLSDQAVHVADVMRDAVEDHAGSAAIQQRAFGAVISDALAVRIYTRTLLGFDQDARAETEVPLLEIIVEDREQNLSHLYTKNARDETHYELLRNNESDESVTSDYLPDDDIYDDIVAQFAKTLHQDIVTPEAAKLFIDTLMEVQMQEMELYTTNQYPDLALGLMEDRFFDAEGLSINATTTEVLRALEAAVQFTDTDLPPQPPYRYNTRKRQRLSKFMQTKVPTTSYPVPVARNELCDIHLACQHILEEIALVNHPVAQAIALLGTRYNDLLDDVQLQHVTTELIQQTHEPRLRELLNQTVNKWRVGKLTTQQALR